MVFLDFVAAGVLIGLLLGGRLENLASLPIRSPWLAFTAIALQVIAFPSGLLPWSTPDGIARALWLVSYALLGALVLRNRKVTGVALVGLGQACNLIAIIANRGQMPVTQSALEGAGLSYHRHNNSISLGHPHFAWLVDRWAVPDWLPLGNVYSAGDTLIGVGVLAALVVAMRPRLPAGGNPPTTSST
jgi:Family of unknown function (DUF5317)